MYGLARLGTHARRRSLEAALVATGALALAVAQEPPDYVDPPLTLDPGSCRPAAAEIYLPLGSEAVVVVGHDDQGRCRIERFAEGEGAYTQLLCLIAADAEVHVWDPRGRDLPAPFVHGEACEVVASGNLLLPGGEPVRFPLGPEPGTTDRIPYERTPTDREDER